MVENHKWELTSRCFIELNQGCQIDKLKNKKLQKTFFEQKQKYMISFFNFMCKNE